MTEAQLEAVQSILVEECGLAADSRQLFDVAVDREGRPALPKVAQVSFFTEQLGVLDLQVRPGSLSLVSLAALSPAQKAALNRANERLYDLLATPLERSPRRRPSSLSSLTERGRV